MKSETPTLGALLIRLRRQCKLSQEEVADRVGVRQNTYAGWESDKTDVKYTYLPKLAEAFGVSVRDLFPTNEADQLTTSPIPAPQPANGRTTALGADHREELIALQRCRIQQLEGELTDLKGRVYRIVGGAIA